MDKDTLIAFGQTVAILARRNPDRSAYHVSSDVVELARHARGIQRRAKHNCNYGYQSDAEEERASKANDKAYAACEKIAVQYDANIERQGDVRGYAVKLLWDDSKPGPSNSMGGNNIWGVPY